MFSDVRKSSSCLSHNSRAIYILNVRHCRTIVGPIILQLENYVSSIKSSCSSALRLRLIKKLMWNESLLHAVKQHYINYFSDISYSEYSLVLQ